MTYEHIVPHREPPHACDLPTSFAGDPGDPQLQAAVERERKGYAGQQDNPRPVVEPAEPGSGSIWRCSCGRRYELSRNDGGQFSWANA